MRGELGDEYTSTVRKLYKGRVPGGADLVTYWFAKAGELTMGKPSELVSFQRKQFAAVPTEKFLSELLNILLFLRLGLMNRG